MAARDSVADQGLAQATPLPDTMQMLQEQLRQWQLEAARELDAAAVRREEEFQKQRQAARQFWEARSQEMGLEKAPPSV